MLALRQYRPSALPLVAQCPNSYEIAEVPVGMNAQYQARLGTAYHELMAVALPKNERPMRDEIANVAAINTVKLEDIKPLIYKGWSWWKGMRQLFPDPIVEQKLSYGRLDGTPDLFSRFNRRIGHGVDHKSGFRQMDHTEQVEGYTWLEFQHDPELEQIFWLVVKVRDLFVIPVIRTREQSDLWYAKFLTHVEQDRFIVNTDCSMCTRILDCPAVKRWIEMAATTLEGMTAEIAERSDALPSGEALWKALETAKMLKGVADRFDTAARNALKVLGPQPLINGLQIKMANTDTSDLLTELVSALLLEYGIAPEDQIKILGFTKSRVRPLLVKIAEARDVTIKSVELEFYSRLERKGGIVKRDRFEVEIGPAPEHPKQLKL